MARRLLVTLSLILACGWCLGVGTPCVLAEDPAAGKTQANVAPAKTDVLMLSYPNDPDTINPLTSNDTVSDAFQRLVCEPMAQRRYDNPDEWEPLLAEKWEFDPETLTYTIHLRHGVKWHPMTLPNGTPLPEKEVTAKDVKFTFDCILNPNVEAASTRSYYEDPNATQAADRYKIEVKVIDNHTLTIRWKKPYFLSDEFSLGVTVLPRHVYSVDENGEPISFDFSSAEFAKGFNNHWANTKLCGTGPMLFQDWKRDDRFVLERNPKYWGASFYFSKLVYTCIPNTNTVVQKLLQNELDWSGIPEKELYLKIADNPNVVSGKVRREEFPYPAYRYVGYNLRHPFLGEKQVRWALSHAVPVQSIIDEVYKGLAEPVTGPFLKGSRACDPNIKAVSYDLDKARQLLDDAGWKDTDGDGVRDKVVNGTKIKAEYELNIYADSPSFQTVAQVIQDNNRKIGVTVKIVPQKWALMLERLDKKNFQATMLGWAMGWKDDPFQLWHGSQAEVPESSNYGGYRNPEVDKAIDELRETIDPARQVELYHKIHQSIYDDQPYTFLFTDKQTGAADSRIEDLKFYKIRPCVDSRKWHASKPRL